MEINELIAVLEVAHANSVTVYNRQRRDNSSKSLLTVLLNDISECKDALLELKSIRNEANDAAKECSNG